MEPRVFEIIFTRNMYDSNAERWKRETKLLSVLRTRVSVVETLVRREGVMVQMIPSGGYIRRFPLFFSRCPFARPPITGMRVFPVDDLVFYLVSLPHPLFQTIRVNSYELFHHNHTAYTFRTRSSFFPRKKTSSDCKT